MSIIQEKEALRKVVSLLKEWAAAKHGEVDYNPAEKGIEIDLIQSAGRWIFGIEYKKSGAAQFVAKAIENLHKNKKK